MLKPGSLVLVTGANGFVGSHLTEALLAHGFRVRCLVRRTADLSFLCGLAVDWAYADLRHGSDLAEACGDVDAVCHCAGLTRALDEQTLLEVNAGGTQSLVRACLQAAPGLRRFLYVSSVAAGGPATGSAMPRAETDPPRPITWYGRSKLAAETALQEAGSALPWTIVRPAPVFGPRDRDFLAYFRLVRWGLSLEVGRQRRLVSLIYVHDLVSLLLLALQDARAVGRLYNGCGQSIDRRQLVDAICRSMGKRTLRISLPQAALSPIAWTSDLQGRLTGRPALLNKQRVLDIRQLHWTCSGARARDELGFEPRYDLDRAVGETTAWYFRQGWL